MEAFCYFRHSCSATLRRLEIGSLPSFRCKSSGRRDWRSKQADGIKKEPPGLRGLCSYRFLVGGVLAVDRKSSVVLSIHQLHASRAPKLLMLSAGILEL
jgi:hypothetical protein